MVDYCSIIKNLYLKSIVTFDFTLTYGNKSNNTKKSKWKEKMVKIEGIAENCILRLLAYNVDVLFEVKKELILN